MSSIDTFRAVHVSGPVLPNRSAVTALALIFEKVYLPANIELVKAFSKKYRIKFRRNDKTPDFTIEGENGECDPFAGLTKQQRITALRFLELGMRFAIANSPLYKEVFETNMFEGGNPLNVKLIKQGEAGELNTYEVDPAKMMLTEGDESLFPKLLSDNYVPIVSFDCSANNNLDSLTAKQVASLLAMKSVEMIFPQTKPAHPELILEARDKLRDLLPPFWSAMFKLTSQLKHLYDKSPSDPIANKDASNLIDTLVRPTLIDLKRKLELERKQWFYRILSPIRLYSR